ncbi:MAG: GTPase/DUF3482 domain-containing protein [Opitutales bacterium]
MSEPGTLPVFAVLGHPNEGKSSVLSTLVEDDRIGVDRTPGTTRACLPYTVEAGGKAVIRFVDTPGFEHPEGVLAWLEDHGVEGPEGIAAFRRAKASDERYALDVELLKPVAAGTALLYVVDASRPVRAMDRTEMEILRRTGLPRLAVINAKTPEERYLEDWKTAFRQQFNALRVFNAHQAAYPERIGLLEALKAIDPDWARDLDTAITLMREERAERLRLAAGELVALVRQACAHRVTGPLPEDPRHEAKLRDQLDKRYQDDLRRFERGTRETLCRLFRHRVFQPQLPEERVLNDDLFSRRTWSFLGLDKRQLTWAGAVGGAVTGAAGDAIFGGVSLGLWAAVGAVAGAAGVWTQGQRLASVQVQKIPLGGRELALGPNHNPQFPFILLDRGLILLDALAHWSHARRNLSGGPEETEAAPVRANNPSRQLPDSLVRQIAALSRQAARDQSAALEETERAAAEALAAWLPDFLGESEA